MAIRNAFYLHEKLLMRLLFFLKNELYVREFKGALSGLRQYLANESPLKMMKNAFYFTLRWLVGLRFHIY